MADEKEKVVYEFQGDISSLKSATQQAIGMLDKFQAQMDKANSDGIVKASQRAQAGFQSSINKITKSITGLQKKMESVGDVKMSRGSEAFTTTETAVNTLLGTLNKLSSSNSITSKSLNAFKTNLNGVATSLKSSAPAYDTLIAKEQKFQSLLSAVETKAGQFGSKVAGATQKVQSAFSTMGTFVSSKLNAMGSMFAPLVSKIQGMKDKASIAGSRIAQVFSTAASAFRRTALSADGTSSAQNRLSSLLDKVREKFKNLKKSVDETSESYDDVGEGAEKAGSSMSAGATVAAAAFSAVKNVISGVVDSFFALAGVDLGNLFADGAKSAIDYVENMNLFQVAMGSSINKGTAFVNKMSEVYGMDPSNLMRTSGYFYQLTDAIGMAEGASASISLSLTKMSNDLASLFNMDFDTVAESLASGMQGMSKTVRKFGMDIRTTTLQETAFRYGLTEQVENMSEANRQALRFITMHEQAQNAINQTTQDTNGGSSAMGDFARNIESPANQLRIFKEQMSQLGRAVGNFIVAPLAKALPYINGFIMALRTLVNFVASLLGISVKAGDSLSGVGDSASDAADGVKSIGDSAGSASKKLKQLIAPFDELNVLQEESDSSGGGGGGMGGDVLDPALAEAIAGMELNLENIQMKANQVRDSIMGFLGLTVTTDPITMEQIISWDRELFLTNVMGSLDQFKNWFLNLDPIIQGAAAITGVSLAFLAFTNPISAIILSLGSLLTFSTEFRESFVGLWDTILQSLIPIGQSLGSLFGTIGTDMVNMWSTHIQPTITAIGNALAPALNTLGDLWGNAAVIVADAFKILEHFWSKVAKPIIEGALKIIQDLANLFKSLWENYVGPVISYIGKGLEDLWINTLSPVINRVIEILGKVWELVMALWNNVIAPLLNWLIHTLGPSIKNVFMDAWDIISQVISDVMGVIDGVLQTFEGLIDFLVGVFTGDWKRALTGLVNIFVGIGNTLISVFETVVNGIIGLINGLVSLIWNSVQAIINGILNAVEWVADLVGWDLDVNLSFKAPQIPPLSIPRIPQMATGGVVTGPTQLIAGEGKYSEAILPLDDSPQMQDLIDKIADAVDKDKPDNSGGPTEVHVYIGGKEYDAFTYKSSQRGKTIVGKQPIKIGG